MVEKNLSGYKGADSEEIVLSLFKRIKESESEKMGILGVTQNVDPSKRSELGTINETRNLYVIRHQESIGRLIATRHMIGTRKRTDNNVYMLTGFQGNPASDNYSNVSEIDTSTERIMSRADTVHGGTGNAVFAMIGSDTRRMLYLYYKLGADEMTGMLRVDEEKEDLRYSLVRDMFVQGYRENGLLGAVAAIEQYASTSYDQHVLVVNSELEMLNKSGLVLPDGEVLETRSEMQVVPTYIMYNNEKLGFQFISQMNGNLSVKGSYAAKGVAPMIERIVQERALPTWGAGSDDSMFR